MTILNTWQLHATVGDNGFCDSELGKYDTHSRFFADIGKYNFGFNSYPAN